MKDHDLRKYGFAAFHLNEKDSLMMYVGHGDCQVRYCGG
jgi:hypothetical protein